MSRDLNGRCGSAGRKVPRARVLQERRSQGPLGAGLLLVLFLWGMAAGSARADDWIRRYVGTEWLLVYDLIPTTDCGWLAAGWKREAAPGDKDDAWVMKLDATGAVEWSRGFGTEELDSVEEVAEAGDGGYVAAVYSEGFGVRPGFPAGPWVVKLDAGGNIEWQKSYEHGTGRVSMAGPTRDGCVLLAGRISADLSLIKLHPTGEEAWHRRIGGAGGEAAQDMEPTPDGGFIIAGGSDTHNADGNTDLWLVKLDPWGEMEWQRAYGGPLEDRFCRAAPSVGGGFVAAASIWIGPNEVDPAILRLDPTGEVLWQRRFDAPGQPGDYLREVAGTADGGALVLLDEDPLGAPAEKPDMRIFRLDPEGNVAWFRDYGWLEQEGGGALVPFGDGGFLTACVTTSFGEPYHAEGWLLSLDEDGLVAGDTCGLAWDAQVTELPLDYVMSFPEVEVQETAVARWDTDVVAYDVPITMIEQCSAPGCLPLRCDGLEAFPDPVCEGTEVTLRLSVACGEGALGVGWDLDGDTLEDEPGSEILATLPPGETRVTAIVTDSCADPGPRRCEVTTDVTVLSSEPPGEISAAGEPRLFVTPGGASLQVEGAPSITAYNVYSDAIGSWYAPGRSTGSVCGITDWTDAPGGRVEFDYQVPSLSWVVVTGSTPCAEGPAGPRSDGTERTTLGDWERCGP